MNSLVSPTKVITNDIIPNPIVATHNPISLPQSLPVTSIGVPMMNVKTNNDRCDKLDNKTGALDAIEAEDEKLSDTKKSDEPMPVEDDTIIEMAQKIEENIGETDVEVTEAPQSIQITNEPTKSNHLSTTEPMECASVNSMASPKHIMTTDVIMAESVSVYIYNTNTSSINLCIFQYFCKKNIRLIFM